MRGSYCDDLSNSSGMVATFRKGAVKLPVRGAGNRLLSDLTPHHLAQFVVSSRNILQFPDADAWREAKPSEGRPFAIDPKFRSNSRLYAEFLHELHCNGVVEPTTGCTTIGTCGIFFVNRKDGLLRLIFDPVEANGMCWPPPHTCLASPANLAALEAASGTTLTLRSGDVDVCFYQFELLDWMKDMFTLLKVPMRYVPKAARKFFPAHAQYATYRVRVLPMGWCWSVYLVQHTISHLINRKVELP